MPTPVATACSSCITTLKSVITELSNRHESRSRISTGQVSEEVGRLALWAGNIGALQAPRSPLSLESRLRHEEDILSHVLELLEDLSEAVGELLEISSGERDGATAIEPDMLCTEEFQDEETELLKGINASITRLFRISSLIRQATPVNLFAKALSRDRYRFNDQFDIAHVGEKYSKLASKEYGFLQKRLGRAITQRRHYLSYIRDHRGKLEDMSIDESLGRLSDPKVPREVPQARSRQIDSSSRPSTFFTKASTLPTGQITSHMLNTWDFSDAETDARSYTTISRSIDGDLSALTGIRVPNLEKLQNGTRNEVECPFCYRIKRFKNERSWHRHVYADLRAYVCTFADCDAPYFADINEWFHHEMQNHRVTYVCRLCQNKNLESKEGYLAHVRRRHPHLLADDEEMLVLDIARQSLAQISATDCPCCSEWVHRLREREGVGVASNQIICVEPKLFKRHLASHLEQLAVFAIPIDVVDEGTSESNAAIEANFGESSKISRASTLTFESERPPSPEELAEVGPERNKGDQSAHPPSWDQQSEYPDADLGFALFTLEKSRDALYWADVIARRQYIPQEKIALKVERFKETSRRITGILHEIPSAGCRRVINDLIESQNEDLCKRKGNGYKFALVSVLVDWIDIGRYKRQMKRVTIILEEQLSQGPNHSQVSSPHEPASMNPTPAQPGSYVPFYPRSSSTEPPPPMPHDLQQPPQSSAHEDDTVVDELKDGEISAARHLPVLKSLCAQCAHDIYALPSDSLTGSGPHPFKLRLYFHGLALCRWASELKHANDPIDIKSCIKVAQALKATLDEFALSASKTYEVPDDTVVQVTQEWEQMSRRYLPEVDPVFSGIYFASFDNEEPLREILQHVRSAVEELAKLVPVDVHELKRKEIESLETSSLELVQGIAALESDEDIVQLVEKEFAVRRTKH